eukprot:tig00001545_g9342.t1
MAAAAAPRHLKVSVLTVDGLAGSAWLFGAAELYVRVSIGLGSCRREKRSPNLTVYADDDDERSVLAFNSSLHFTHIEDVPVHQIHIEVMDVRWPRDKLVAQVRPVRRLLKSRPPPPVLPPAQTTIPVDSYAEPFGGWHRLYDGAGEAQLARVFLVASFFAGSEAEALQWAGTLAPSPNVSPRSPRPDGKPRSGLATPPAPRGGGALDVLSLYVRVIAARGLPLLTRFGRPNPYVFLRAGRASFSSSIKTRPGAEAVWEEAARVHTALCVDARGLGAEHLWERGALMDLPIARALARRLASSTASSAPPHAARTSLARPPARRRPAAPAPPPAPLNAASPRPSHSSSSSGDTAAPGRAASPGPASHPSSPPPPPASPPSPSSPARASPAVRRSAPRPPRRPARLTGAADLDILIPAAPQPLATPGGPRTERVRPRSVGLARTASARGSKEGAGGAGGSPLWSAVAGLLWESPRRPGREGGPPAARLVLD